MRRGWVLGFACGVAAACSAGAGGELVGDVMEDVGAAMEGAGGAVREAGQAMDGTAQADDGGNGAKSVSVVVLEAECVESGAGEFYAEFADVNGLALVALGCFEGDVPENRLRCATRGYGIEGTRVRVFCGSAGLSPLYSRAKLHVLEH